MIGNNSESVGQTNQTVQTKSDLDKWECDFSFFKFTNGPSDWAIEDCEEFDNFDQFDQLTHQYFCVRYNIEDLMKLHDPIIFPMSMNDIIERINEIFPRIFLLGFNGHLPHCYKLIDNEKYRGIFKEQIINAKIDNTNIFDFALLVGDIDLVIFLIQIGFDVKAQDLFNSVEFAIRSKNPFMIYWVLRNLIHMNSRQKFYAIIVCFLRNFCKVDLILHVMSIYKGPKMLADDKAYLYVLASEYEHHNLPTNDLYNIITFSL